MTDMNKETFKEKIIDIFSSGRVWVLIFFIILSLFAINYTFNNTGVVINGVVMGSPAEKAGISFDTQAQLRDLEKITYINDHKVTSVKDYYNYMDNISTNTTLTLITNTNPSGYNIFLPYEQNKTAAQAIGINVRAAPSSNIRLGIELEGGSRLILKPISNITDSQFDLLVNTLQNRLNIYGASGTKVNKLVDSFTKEKYIVIESTSSNKNDIFELTKRQGKFEAKVGNVTVFTGNNIIQVFNDPQHAGLEGCNPGDNGTVCTYRFSLEINSVGADSFFNQTSRLSVTNGYLSKKVSFYLDGKLITSLNIASSFKYQKITNPQITISGNPAPTEKKAKESGRKEMKFMQTILSTKSLPSKLEVAQSYSVSTSLGEQLLKNSVWVAIAAILLVSSIIAFRYRHKGIFVGIFITLMSEVILVFGIAAFMKLSIDLAAIGGLIAAIGTGVDDQIIITDEYFRRKNSTLSSRKKIKHAFYIILISYFTTLAAMLPFLFSASLSLVKGFAFMTIAGVSIGVLVSRPAYAQILNRIMTSRTQRRKEDDDI